MVDVIKKLPVPNLESKIPANPVAGLQAQAQTQAASLASQMTQFKPAETAKPSQIISTNRDTFRKSGSKVQYQLQIVSASTSPDKPVISVAAFLPENISLDVSANYTPLMGEGLIGGGNMAEKALKLGGVSGVTQEMSLKLWESTDGVVIQLPLIFVAGETIGGRVTTSVMDSILDLMSLVAPYKDRAFLTPPGPTLTTDWNRIRNVAAATANVASTVAINAATGVLDAATGGTATAAVNQVAQAASGDSSLQVFDTNQVDAVKKSLDAAGEAFQDLIVFDKKIAVYLGDFMYFDNVVIKSVSPVFDTIMGPPMPPTNKSEPLRAAVTVTFETMFTPTIQDLKRMFYRDVNAT